MAKRYEDAHKGSKKKGRKKGRKRTGRKAAGRRLAEFNRLAKLHGKRYAHDHVFGGKRKAHRKGKKHGKRHGHSGRSYYRRSNYGRILADIQREEGTTGFPPTQAERDMANAVLAHMGGPGPVVSAKERLRRRFAAEKEALVKKLASEKLREAEAEYKKDLKEKAKREAESELRDL